MDLKELAAELFCQFDPEKKGYITQEELLNLSSGEGPFNEKQVLSIFSLLDKDKKGIITQFDFTNAFLDISDTYNDNVEDDTNIHVRRVTEEIYQDGDEDENENNKQINDYYTYFSPNGEFIINNDLLNDSDGNADPLHGSESSQESSQSERDSNDEDFINGSKGQIKILKKQTNKTHHSHDSLSSLKQPKHSTKEDLTRHDYEDDYWWEYGKPLNGFLKIAGTRTDSLPSLNNLDKSERNLRLNFLFSKQWKSCDSGIDKCFVAKNSKALKKENTEKFTRNVNRTKNSNASRVRKNSSNPRSNRRINNIHLKNGYNKNHQVLEAFEDDLSLSGKLRSYSDTIPNENNIETNGFFRYDNRLHKSREFSSYNSLNTYPSTKVTTGKKLILRSQSYGSIDDHNENRTNELYFKEPYLEHKNRFSTYNSNEDMLSRDNGLCTSCESMLSSRDGSTEDWQSFLKRIQGVALFGGNQSLRFIWQQIGYYQKDLLIPLEDFLKGVIEEHKRVYTQCQEIENTLHLKIEQHEKEVDHMYEEFERTTGKEIQQMEKKHLEREDSIKVEYRKLIELKEQTNQETVKQTHEMMAKLESCEEEISELKEVKMKVEEQCRQLISEQHAVVTESEQITLENQALREQLESRNENLREIQEYLSQVSKSLEKEKHSHKSVIRRFKDLLEEKEFLEASLSTLSIENVELRNLNKSILSREEDMESSLRSYKNRRSSSIASDIVSDLISSPRRNNKKTDKGLSLLDEFNAVDVVDDKQDVPRQVLQDTEEKTGEKLELIHTDEGNQIENKNFQYDFSMVEKFETNERKPSLSTRNIISPLEQIIMEEETEEKGNDEIDDSSFDDSLHHMSQDSYPPQTSTPMKMGGLKFASGVQTEYKVIFCGDAAVGKTSLIQRICFDKFYKQREMTMKLDSYKKLIECDQSSIALNMWDTVGQERFNSLPRSYYRRADVVVLVYDMTQESSFTNAKSWLRTIHECTHENVLIILVGNKLDLHHKRSIANSKGAQLASENDAIFIEASAKSAENITQLLNLMCRTLFAQNEYVLIHNYFDRTPTTTLLLSQHQKGGEKQKCCQ